MVSGWLPLVQLRSGLSAGNGAAPPPARKADGAGMTELPSTMIENGASAGPPVALSQHRTSTSLESCVDSRSATEQVTVDDPTVVTETPADLLSPHAGRPSNVAR